LKKALTIILILVAVLAAGSWLFREQLMVAAIASRIAPEHNFEPALAPAPPDYAQDAVWAALPAIEDPSDDSPDTPGPAVGASHVGVFFLHPTSYFGKGNWNQSLDDAGANWITDQRVLRHQASVFNHCCEVFAPRYRQATFYSYLDDEGNGERALDLAFTDVLAAFENFLARNAGRPFILAGHSQGSQHGARLLRERIVGSPEQTHLVAAYLVGFAITADDVGGVPICDSPEQTGCVIGWNAVEGDGPGLNAEGLEVICVNPLSWRADHVRVSNEHNSGGIGFPSYTEKTEGEDHTAMVVEPAVADAACSGGNLVVRDLRSEAFPARMIGNSMHVYDYSLYYTNVRDNALNRVREYMTKSRAGQ